MSWSLGLEEASVKGLRVSIPKPEGGSSDALNESSLIFAGSEVAL